MSVLLCLPRGDVDAYLNGIRVSTYTASLASSGRRSAERIT